MKAITCRPAPISDKTIAATLGALILGTGLWLSMPAAAHAACMAEDRVDKSTAEQATRKFAAAGLKVVAELHKGCDNYWHAIVVAKDGQRFRVVLSPAGEIVMEGD